MATISDPDAALRLARAIVADIRLYNEAAITSGRSLAPEIAEGRELFRARVVTELHPVFEEAVAPLEVQQASVPTVGSPALPIAPAAGPGSRPGVLAGSPDPSSSDPTTGRILVALVVLIALVLAIGWRSFGPR